MMKEISKGYYIQETELSILLAIKGLQELYGIRLNGIESITQEEIYQTVFTMLKKGILNKLQDRIQIEDSLDNLMDVIKNAQSFWVYADVDDSSPESYYYVAGKDAILIQSGGQQNNLLSIEKMTSEEIMEVMTRNWLEQNAKEVMECKTPPEGLCEEARRYWLANKETILQKPKVKQLLQEYDVHTKCKKKQVIKFAMGLDEYIVYSDEQGDKIFDVLEMGGEKS